MRRKDNYERRHTMNLIEAMEKSIETNGIISTDRYVLSMVYSKRYNCFLWCDDNGKVIPDRSDRFGVKRVI